MSRFAPLVGRWVAIAASLFLPDFAEAGGIVGTGTAASCTEAALDARLAGGGTVTFHCGGGQKTISITTTKVIAADTTLVANGDVKIDGGSAVRLFSVNTAVPFRVEGLVLASGKSPIGGAGAIHNDGGVVTVVDSRFENNETGGGGGAIYNEGSGIVHISRTEFIANSTDGSLGADPARAYGGAIFNEVGAVSITDSLFAFNDGLDPIAGGGGAIANGDGTSTAAELTVTNSLFMYNTAYAKGGAIWNGGAMTATNSTFYRNGVDDVGGAIYGFGSSGTITNCTFDQNTAVTAGSSIFSDGDFVITNSIVSRGLVSEGDPSNCATNLGTITDGGYNIDDGDTCFPAACSPPGGTSWCSTDPGFDPRGLLDNGGPTETIGLCSGPNAPVYGCYDGPAVGGGDQTVCSTTTGSGPVANIDQRHFSRPGTGETSCSIGAFEPNALPGPCGDGFAEDGEQCDDGNTVDGDCCSSTCTFEDSGSACADDGSLCSTDVCDGSGTCRHYASNAGGLCRVGEVEAVTGPASLPAGAQGFPFAIDEDWFDVHSCGPSSSIQFYPTSVGSCTAFHTFTETPASASKIKSIVTGLAAGTFSSPATDAGGTYFELVGGTVATALGDMKDLYDLRKDANGMWSVLVPVYAASGCANPASSSLIVGFATARIYELTNSPASIRANVDCNIIEIGEGGGPNFGTLYAANSDCNSPEYCSGTSTTCPDDAMEPAGTACDSDGTICTADVCDGSGTCTHAAGNAGTQCRAAAGVCDAAEVCDGTSSICPADAKSTAVCRGAGGVCDVAESCNGVSNTCPADAKSTASCRAAGGVCDLAETCDGISDACPADAKSTASCRASGGVCDAAETCDGVADACPADAKSTSVCRASAGVCDAAETCDGTGDACPADAKSTSVCRAAGGVCDVAESCDGVADLCPADAKSTGVCRLSSGVCDVGAETCDGVGDVCPADQLAVAGTTCRASAGVCDPAEACSGTSAVCSADTLSATTTACRASAGICDTAENCSGTTSSCPADAFVAASAICRAASGVCDVSETCTGGAAACPADAVASGAVECRASAGECDQAESCTGAAKLCPGDDYAAMGTACTADTEVCTDDYCDGTGACSHPPIPLAPVCNWAVVGGSDTQKGRVRTRIESQVGGSVCADRADIGESSTLTGPASWALLEDSSVAARVRLNAAVPDGSVVTGGGCLKGFGDSPIFGTLTGEICCADGDVELPGGNPANVINACGLHPLVGDCETAKAQIPGDVAYLDALAATATIDTVSVAIGTTGTIVAGAGLNVIDIGRIRLDRAATLTIDAQGNTDAVVVLRLANGLSTKEAAAIVLAGGVLPENVLFYAVHGSCSVGLSNVGAGTLFCPEGTVKLRQATEWTGAVAGGGSIDVGWNVKLTHVPFLGLAQ